MTFFITLGTLQVLKGLYVISCSNITQLAYQRYDASCFQAKRHAEFKELKKQIILYMDELDQIPETSFEKDVICEDEDSFCLSRDNITSLKLLICQVGLFFNTVISPSN